MTAFVEQAPYLDGRSTGLSPIARGQWIVLAVLAIAEVVSALFLASINPSQGYDETWHLLGARHFQGGPLLPFHYSRPPMLPLLLAMLGPYYRLVSALAHIGSAALTFLILRRLVSVNLAIAGLVVFMACGELRLYNMLTLTEMPSILFFLLATYAFVARSPLLVGGALALAVLTSWGMATVPPVVFLLYAARRQWRSCATLTTGLALVWLPFLIKFTLTYGHPLAPFVANLDVQLREPNHWSYYLERPYWLPLALTGGSVVAACWAWRNRRNWRSHSFGLYLILFGSIITRMVLLHAVSVKAVRFLVPLIPILLLLSMLMIWHCGRRRILQGVLCGVLLISVMPTKKLFYQIYGLAHHPLHGIAMFKDSLAELPPAEPIYTDLNDLAVSSQTAHPTVPVTGSGSSHHPLGNRKSVTRGEIPPGALYFTWEPGCGEVLASHTVPKGETLWLVRWLRDATEEEEQGTP